MTVRARAAAVALVVVGASVAAGGCPGHRGPSLGPDADDAVVKVTADVPDAGLFVDGRYVGPVGEYRGGVAVEPGVHRFELRHDDHFSWYAELTLAARERKSIVVDLAPRLP